MKDDMGPVSTPLPWSFLQDLGFSPILVRILKGRPSTGDVMALLQG